MSDGQRDIAHILPNACPSCANCRLLLFAMRRIADGGLNDAHAASALLAGFGSRFRRPLILLRAWMAELSRVASSKLLVAPCCCPRMTGAEAVLIMSVVEANSDPRGTHDRLATLLGIHNCLGALSSAQALGQAFADLGRPLGKF